MAATTQTNSTTVGSASETHPIWKKIYPLSLILIFLAMTVMSFSYGLSGDEVDMNEYGKAILKYFTSFFSDETVFNMPKEYNRDGVIQYYGGLFDLLCAIINTFSPFDEYTTRHILNAWVGFLGIYFASRIARMVMNDLAGTLTVLIMFLSPFFLGHAMNNPKDIPFASSYIMAIWFIIQLFERLPHARKTDYLWAILSIGATINIRVGGILLIPYLFVFAFLVYIVRSKFRKEDVKLFAYLKPILITGALGYLCGSLLWPYGLKNPIQNPLTALSEMSNFKVNIRQLFEGEKIFSGELPSYFLTKSFIITNSYAVLAGLALMIPFLWWFRTKPKSEVLYFILFTAFFPLVYIIYSKSNVYHAWRHILFIFPSMAVLAVFGWYAIGEWLQKYKIRVAALALLGFLLLEPLYFIASSFPNTITYHNAIVGGVEGAYNQYEVDYYYNSLKQCADWFRKNEYPKIKAGDSVVVLSNAAHLLNKYFPGDKKMHIDYMRYYERNQKYWDYAVWHIALIPNEDIASGAWLPKSTIYKVEVFGKPLCAIIKRPSKEDLIGFSYLNKNQPDSALLHFKAYLQKDPDNTFILNTTANVLMQTGNIPEAESLVQRAYKVDSANLETKNLYGILAIQKNDFATAASIFASLIQQNPQYAQGYFYLGIAQQGLGNFQQALQNLNTASQDESLRRSCYKAMGDVYTQMGNTTEAAKLYQAAGM